VHRSIDKFEYDPRRGRFRNWLGTIAMHEISKHVQRDRRPGKGGGDGAGDMLAQHASGEVDAAWQEEFQAHIFEVAIQRVRSDFDDPTWQAFDATWMRDVKPRDAAELLGRTTGWVYKARFRVLERLRSEIEFLTSDAAVFHRLG
jgi:DNA-directed RNA polymerase specialized sigma24 family protein